MRRERLLAIAALAALALITVARIRLIDVLPDQGYFAKYTIFADQIRAGHIPRDRLLDLSPLYLWFVVAMRSVGAGFHGIRTLQIVLVSVAALLVGFAARRWGTMAMIAAPILLLGSRGALVCATELEPETLILLFDAAAVACLGLAVSESRGLGGAPPRDSETPRPRDITGLLLGLSAICRPVALLAAAGLSITVRSWRIIASALLPVMAMLIVNTALTGEVTLMDPGTVFYEGMNPNATGYEGVQPRIVNEMERQSRDPDYLHVAYRVIASRALGHPVRRAQSNRYWTSKAVAFVEAYPMAALRLTLRKLYFAFHSYEAYDLATMARKNILLARFPFVPFGVIVALAATAFLLRVRGLAPLVVFAAATGLVMVIFYVTARQRNAMLPPMVVLAAAGLAEIVARRHLVAAVPAVIVAVLLSINGPPQIEDAAGWQGLRNGFDQAISLEQASRWREADAILAQMEDYRPMRENRAVSSVAYYRAVAAQHLGQPGAAVLLFLDRAEREAPGNEHVLAMRSVFGDLRARQLLFALHDPITAQRALRGGT